MVALAAILKNCFELFYPEPKGQLTRYFFGSFEMTCRLKVAKIILIENPRWPPSWKSILNLFSWTESQLTRNWSGNHVSNTGSSWPSCYYARFVSAFKVSQWNLSQISLFSNRLLFTRSSRLLWQPHDFKLNFYHFLGYFSCWQICNIFLIFPRK